jgi:hypothetical protein
LDNFVFCHHKNTFFFFSPLFIVDDVQLLRWFLMSQHFHFRSWWWWSAFLLLRIHASQPLMYDYHSTKEKSIWESDHSSLVTVSHSKSVIQDQWWRWGLLFFQLFYSFLFCLRCLPWGSSWDLRYVNLS